MTTSITLQPLTHSAIINGKFVRNNSITTPNGVVMNDRWIYVNDGYGMYSINVVRSYYCTMQNLKNTSILEEIKGKKVTPRLQRFIDEVASTMCFTKFGKTYLLKLKKVGRKYDIQKVVPFWATTSMGANRMIPGFGYAHGLVVDIDRAFYVNGIM